jgi:DNA-binding transcriptional LysR family regulator
MESELGGLLFSRERNNTHLTELGRLIEPHLRAVIACMQDVRETARRFLRLDDAQLRLGVMRTIGPARFVTLLGRFFSDYPGIDATFIEDVPSRLCDKLQKGEIDAALMARPQGFSAPLSAQKLYSERFVIACSSGHRLARRNVVHVSELMDEVYLHRIDCEYGDRLQEACDAGGARIAMNCSSEREDWILTKVASGMGVCFVPEFCHTVPGIISRPIIDPSVSRDVCLVTVAGRRWSAPLSAFVAAVRQHRWPGTAEPAPGEPDSMAAA